MIRLLMPQIGFSIMHEQIGETSATEGAGSKRIMHLMGSLQRRYVSVAGVWDNVGVIPGEIVCQLIDAVMRPN